MTMFLVKVGLMAASTGLMLLIFGNALMCAGLATRHVVRSFSKSSKLKSAASTNHLKRYVLLYTIFHFSINNSLLNEVRAIS